MTKKPELGKLPSQPSIKAKMETSIYTPSSGPECNEEKNVPVAVLKRVPVYYRFLNDLSAKGITRISSTELAAKVGITASQLRQDLSWFGSFGQQGYGYRVTDLLGEVRRILGLNHLHQLVLVGIGHLGRAISNYRNFKQRGFEIEALFDNDPQVTGEIVNGLIVRDIVALPDYLKHNPIDIGVITVPAVSAQVCAEMLVAGGVKGIWSFAPFALKVPADVVVEHVHLGESLLVLSLKMQQNNVSE
jgi:redox-sensing transcriptional repressor